MLYLNAAAAKLLQSCQTLCDPTDGSPPGSPVPGILQARTLEWVAISFSNAWKWKMKVKLISCVRLFKTPWTAAHQAPPSTGFSRQEYWSGVPLLSPVIPQYRVKILKSMKTATNIPHHTNFYKTSTQSRGLPRWLSGKKIYRYRYRYRYACQCRRCGFDTWVGKIPWRRKWLPTSVFLPGKSHGQSNLVGYSPWGCKESVTTKQLSMPTRT